MEYSHNQSRPNEKHKESELHHSENVANRLARLHPDVIQNGKVADQHCQHSQFPPLAMHKRQELSQIVHKQVRPSSRCCDPHDPRQPCDEESRESSKCCSPIQVKSASHHKSGRYLCNASRNNQN